MILFAAIYAAWLFLPVAWLLRKVNKLHDELAEHERDFRAHGIGPTK